MENLNIEIFKQRSKFSTHDHKASSSCYDLSWQSTPLEIQGLWVENFELWGLELPHLEL